MTTEEILKRTRQCGDCLEWTGSLVHGIAPVISLDRKKQYAKRVIMQNAGHDCTGKCVTSNCGNRLCVNPSHLRIVTKRALIKRVADTGVFRKNSFRANVAAAKRIGSKLSDASVQEIRDSDEPVKSLAERYGISEAYAYMIRRGQWRRDYSNPFSGLMS